MQQEDNTDYEYYYCKHCKRLFRDIKHEPYYMHNHFVDNFMRFVWNEPSCHNPVTPNYHSQCPRCLSIDVLCVNDVLSGKLVIKSEKIYESKDTKMLKCLGEWLKFYGEITGYYIDRDVLYSDGKRVKRQIQRLLGRKMIALNRMNNKIEYEEKDKSIIILIKE